MKAALLGLLAIVAATAQDPTGRIEGTVLDSVSHQPVKSAVVSINFMGNILDQNEKEGLTTKTTDASGTFAFDHLLSGDYLLTVRQQKYSQTRKGGVQKTVHVSAGDTASGLTVELVPGATITGRIVDEDGDPLSGCTVQPHSAKDFKRGVPMARLSMSREDGSYRLSGIPAGKYTFSAQCRASVFQQRPLSEGPDPPPSMAYPVLSYPETVELVPGAEQPGIDFQMRPVPVTHIHGMLAAGSVDWRGRNNLQIRLVPLDSHAARIFGSSGQINAKDGSFEFREVFPGSYRVVVSSQNYQPGGGRPDTSDQVGAVALVEVADKPIELSLQLQRAMDISGAIEIERGHDTPDQITPVQITVQLTSESQIGPVPMAQVNEDGNFTVKSVLPGEWRIRTFGGLAFLKSARFGGADVTNRPFDLSSDSPAPLRIVVSTNTATVRGTAPAGQQVFSERIDEDDPQQGSNSVQADPSGQFILQGLAPGKYRIGLGENDGLLPDEGGQEVTVSEGDTVTLELKPSSK